MAGYGCGSDDGGPIETARGTRGYSGADSSDVDVVDSCCDHVEVKTDATVHVSPRGDDDAAGTPNAPVLTLARAIRLAAERGHSVYVSP